MIKLYRSVMLTVESMILWLNIRAAAWKMKGIA